MHIYAYYCIFIHKAIKGATRRGTRAGALFPVYILKRRYIVPCKPLFIYIIFLFYLLLFALIYYIYILLFYVLSFAKSKLYIFAYRIRARGFGRLGGFLGRFGGLSGGRVRQTVVLWTLGRLAGAFWVRFSVRAGVPLPFFARDQYQRVYPLIVFGKKTGEYRVGGE